MKADTQSRKDDVRIYQVTNFGKDSEGNIRLIQNTSKSIRKNCFVQKKQTGSSSESLPKVQFFYVYISNTKSSSKVDRVVSGVWNGASHKAVILPWSAL